jgi:hypothetical protein
MTTNHLKATTSWNLAKACIKYISQHKTTQTMASLCCEGLWGLCLFVPRLNTITEIKMNEIPTAKYPTKLIFCHTPRSALGRRDGSVTDNC